MAAIRDFVPIRKRDATHLPVTAKKQLGQGGIIRRTGNTLINPPGNSLGFSPAHTQKIA